MYLLMVPSSNPTVLMQHSLLPEKIPVTRLFLGSFRWIRTPLFPLLIGIENGTLWFRRRGRHMWTRSSIKSPSNTSIPRSQNILNITFSIFPRLLRNHKQLVLKISSHLGHNSSFICRLFLRLISPGFFRGKAYFILSHARATYADVFPIMESLMETN